MKLQKQWLFLFLISGFFASGFLGCGMAPSFALRLQGLDAALIKQIRYLDMALFNDKKVNCQAITPENYTSNEDPIASARYKAQPKGDGPIVSLEVGVDKKVAVNGLITNKNNILVYIVALGPDAKTNKKKVIAHGCVDGISLVAGNTVSLTVQLKAYP